MNGASKIQATHQERQAVVYLRQSTTKQVLENRESAVNQRALAGRLHELGWKHRQIAIVEDDQGQSGREATGREGFQRLVADVSLRKIGLIMGYEVSRLARNCADWYRLLELCALFDTLIADADGIYHPRDYNDRLLLGLKGTMSEAELHSLRLRLDAGRLSKARRGELVQHLPSGYIRGPDGSVLIDPDSSVEQRIRLVFRKFLELGSADKVFRYLVQNDLPLPRRQTSGLYAGDLIWKPASRSTLYSILQNPAYAGAFAYGRRAVDPARQIPGRPASGHPRQPRGAWQALVKDVYPAYIAWDEYEQVQQRLAENYRRMQDRLVGRQTERDRKALLNGLLRCGICGHQMCVRYKDGGFRYTCNWARQHYGQHSCQCLSGPPIDEAVIQEFFRVLEPAQIDALEQVTARRAEHQQELISHLEQEVARLGYAARRAEKQYNCVDPENRLIASTLEKKWEVALGELEAARAKLAAAQTALPAPVVIPAELREAFADVGRRLPSIWPRLSTASRRSLLRTLVREVHLARQPDQRILVRIVWCGDLVSETTICTPVFRWQGVGREQEIVREIRRLTETRQSIHQIAAHLNAQGYHPCRSRVFTWSVVMKLKQHHGIRSGVEEVRRGGLPCGYTIREMARLLAIPANWIYRQIGRGRLQLLRDARYGCYLFPKTPEAVETVRRLRSGQLRHASFPEVHHDG